MFKIITKALILYVVGIAVEKVFFPKKEEKSSPKKSSDTPSEYDSYFPSPTNEKQLLSSNTSIEYTVQEMRRVVLSTLNQTKEFTEHLTATYGKTEAFLKALFEIVLTHIRYVEDEEGEEQLRTPARIWKDKKGDCDDTSILIASVLKNAGWSAVFRIANYGKGYQHVYCLARLNGTLVPLDTVAKIYNYETPTKTHRDYEI